MAFFVDIEAAMTIITASTEVAKLAGILKKIFRKILSRSIGANIICPELCLFVLVSSWWLSKLKIKILWNVLNSLDIFNTPPRKK